jgi:tetratricopeptide (TPR) repeat protein
MAAISPPLKGDAQNLDWTYLLALVNRGLGMFYQKGELRAKAYERFDRMRVLCEQVYRREPAWLGNHRLHALSVWYLGETVPADDKRRASLYAESLRRLTAMNDDAPADALHVADSTVALTSMAQLAYQNRDYPSAKASLDRGIALMSNLSGAARGVLDFQQRLASLFENEAAWVFSPSHDDAQAAAAYSRALALRTAIAKRAPTADNLSALAFDHGLLGDAYLEAKKTQDAVASYAASFAEFDDGVRRFPGNVALLESEARRYWWLSLQWRKRSDFPATLEAFKRAAQTAKQAFDLDPVNRTLFKLLSNIRSDSERFEKDVRQGQWVAGDPEAKATSAAALADRIVELAIPKPETLLAPRGARPASNTATILDVEQPQAWSIDPLIPGNWRTLPPAESQVEARRITGAGVGALPKDSQILRIRALPVSFYHDAVLYEAEVRRRGGGTGVLTYIRAGDSVLAITGKSAPIHAFNLRTTPTLDTSSDAAAYLDFFAASITSENGTFRIVNSPSELGWAAAATDEQRRRVARIVTPLQMSSETADGKWNGRGTVRYGNALFYALFQLTRSGSVEMENDSPAAVDQPFLSERFVDGVRTVTDFDYQKQQLSGRATTDAQAGRWPEALTAQQELVTLIRKSDAIDDTDRNKLLSHEYVRLSWYQLHTRDFAGALASCEAGEHLDPGSLLLKTNHAHALLFLGRANDAEELYRQYIGQKVSGQTTWEETVLKDLSDLEKAGLTDPGFGRIRALLSAAGPK